MNRSRTYPTPRRCPLRLPGVTGVALCALAPLLTSCADTPAAGPAHIDDLPALTLTEQLRIGSVDDPDIGFSTIGSVIAGDDGRVYAFDSQASEVRVYDDAGALLHRFGRKGEGPGEFQRASEMGLRGDTLWVADLMQRRLSLFTTDGVLLKTYSPKPTSIELAPGINVTLLAGGIAPDGTLTSAWSIMIPRVAPDDTVMIPVVRMDTAGAILDTVRYEPWAFPPQSTVSINGRDIPVPGAPSSSPIQRNAYDGGTFVVERQLAASPDDGVFTVRRIGSAGDTLYMSEFRYRPRGYSAAVMDTLAGRYTAMWDMMGVNAEAAHAQVRDAMVMPPFQPPVASVEAGRDGSLWLRRDDDGGPVAHWLVLNADGSPAGTIDLPRSTRVHWVDGAVAWVAELDDFDVPWLVKYTIQPEETELP